MVKKIRGPIFLSESAIKPNDYLLKDRMVVVDVLEVDQDFSGTNQAFAVIALSVHGEAPLRTTIRGIAVERLKQE